LSEKGPVLPLTIAGKTGSNFSSLMKNLGSLYQKIRTYFKGAL